MHAIHKRVLFGAIAAALASYVALDASLFRPSEYPLAHKLFDGDWAIYRNMSFALASMGTALFGYIALNVKDDAPTPPAPH